MFVSKTQMLMSVVATLAQVACAKDTTSYVAHVPLLMWSDKTPTFNKVNTYLNDVLDENDVASALSIAAAHNTAKDQWKMLDHDAGSFKQSEVFCVFVNDALSLQQLGQLTTVQDSFHKATSSVAFPQTFRTDALTKSIDKFAAAQVSADKLKEFFQSQDGKKLLSNSKTDIVLVKLGDKLSDDQIKNSIQLLQELTSNSVDFALTGDTTPTEPVVVPARRLADATRAPVIKGDFTKEEALQICGEGYMITGTKDNAFCFSHYVRITPHVITGILLSFFLLFLLYVGLTMMSEIQTPLKYPLTGPPRGKEF